MILASIFVSIATPTQAGKARCETVTSSPGKELPSVGNPERLQPWAASCGGETVQRDESLVFAVNSHSGEFSHGEATRYSCEPTPQNDTNYLKIKELLI